MTVQEKELMQIDLQKEAFFRKYPDVKRSENIKCLNLVMKKEIAMQILRGEKTVEFREYSQHYISRLFDRKLEEYGNGNVAEEDMVDFVDFARPLRQVDSIHFYSYSNDWYLDVEVVDNWTVRVDDEGVDDLRQEFGCHELDEFLEDMNAKGAEERPVFFYFALGKVLGSNLEGGE